MVGGQPSGVLFLCVANSARSQIAEAVARDLAPAGVEVFSAGSSPTHVNPLAVQALTEAGVDAANLSSKGIGEVPMDQIGTVVTLCADEVCPVLPGGVLRLHWPQPDPADLADFRSVVAAVRECVKALFAQT